MPTTKRRMLLMVSLTKVRKLGKPFMRRGKKWWKTAKISGMGTLISWEEFGIVSKKEDRGLPTITRILSII